MPTCHGRNAPDGGSAIAGPEKLDALMQERLAGFVSLTDLAQMPADEARRVNDREAAVMFGPPQPVHEVSDREIAGPGGRLTLRIYRPEAVGRPALVYFHGGGWVVGSLASHDGVARHLVHFGHCVVISVDYRLAPEHRFPAALDDAWSATMWACEHAAELRVDATRLMVGGDSAGGNLAAVVARRARDRGVRVALQLLVYPVLDLSQRGLGDPDNEYWARQYLGAAEPDDPDASPLMASGNGGLPPAVILSCGLDSLRKQAERYARRLGEAGVSVEHILYPGLIHGAFRMPAVLPGAQKMLDDSAAALRRAW